MGEFDEYDDFSDLYGDVELQVSSAISAIQALSQLPVEDDRYVGGFKDVEDGVGGLNAEEGEGNKEVGVEELEDGNDSDTEDDFDILLNDDGDYYNSNFNVNGTGFETGGKFGNDDDEYVNVGENEGNFGVENGGGSGEKEGCSGGSYKLQYNRYCAQNGVRQMGTGKSMGYISTSFPSKLKSNGSTGGASYLSTFVRDDWESKGGTYKFEKICIGSESRHHFSLPRSRTILDVNINTIVHKPWRNSGVDITDFFNFGFDEDSWKIYCNHLDSYRNQTGNVTGSAAYKNVRHMKEHVAEVEHDYQRRAISLTTEISCRLPESEMLKGRAIQVEEGLGERQPSIDVRLPVHRDSDVVIEIPVRDMEEGHSNSYKVPFNGMTNYVQKESGDQEVGVDDAGDILYSSTSEDEIPILKGPTRKSNSHRHISKGDGDPPQLDSDSYESIHVSDANELEVHVTKCDSNRLAEEIRSSDEPEKSDGKGQPAITPKKKAESSQSQQSHCSSPSQSDYIGSRDGAYSYPDKLYNHPKKVSQTSASELWESSKDSTNCGVSLSSDYKYVARSRSPVRRNMKFRPRRSNLKLKLKNHLYNECTLHMSDAEGFYEGHFQAVDFHKQRKRHHDFNSYGDKVGLEHFLTYPGARFSCNDGSAFAGYSHGKDSQDCRYKSPKYTGGNVKGKQPFLEQRTQRLGDEVMQRKWNYRKGIYVQEMDSSICDVSGQLIAEHTPYLYSGDHTRSKRKASEFYIKKRIESDDFSAEYNYDHKFTQEKYQPMPDNSRERDYLDKRHDRELPYTRREAESTLMNARRYGDPFHDHEDNWHSNSEDERSRYGPDHLYFRSSRELKTTFWGQMRTAALSRNDMIGRHGRQKRQNCVERYRDCNKLDGYTGGYINSDESIRHTYDHDSYVVGRSKNWQSEVLHWSEQENDRHEEDNMEAVGISYPFGRTSSYKKFDSRPGSGHGRKLIDGREPNKRRYELPIVGDRCSQFDQNSNSVHRNNLRQAPPSCWDPDSHIFVENGKSSSRFKAGNLMHSGRYDVLDWNDDLECETINSFNGSHFRKVIQADSPRINGFHNGTKWHKKLSNTLQKNFLDFEGGQIVPDDLNNKSRKKEGAIHQSIKAEELEKPRIMEILAKMEKRRERFQQPLTSKNVEEDKNSKPVTDSNGEAKIQRPARKRKWGGN